MLNESSCLSFFSLVVPLKFLRTTEEVQRTPCGAKKLTTSAKVCKCLLGCCCCICDCVVLFSAVACPDCVFGILRPVKHQTMLMAR